MMPTPGWQLQKKLVKMCICTICFCMRVVYFVFWYVKHRLKKRKKKKNPTYLPYFFFLCYANQTIFFRPKRSIFTLKIFYFRYDSRAETRAKLKTGSLFSKTDYAKG